MSGGGGFDPATTPGLPLALIFCLLPAQPCSVRMDNIFELLVPLLIAAVYFFGNMFSGKLQQDEEQPPALPRQRSAAGEEEEELDAFERQRRIQAEIRRKIMERRRSSGSEVPQAAPVVQEMQEGRSDSSSSRQTRQAQKHTREAVHQTREVRTSRQEAARDDSYPTTPPAFSWDESDNAYDSGIEAQLERIQATRRQAERLQQQAAKGRKAATSAVAPPTRSGGYLSGSVRESLQDPQAARVAFIYGEVLGPPIALRKGPGSVPGLN